MRKILVCFDLAQNPQQLISESIKFAKAFNASIYVNYVAPLLEESNDTSMSDIEENYPVECQALNNLAKQIRQEGVDTHSILATGNPPDEILEEVNKLDIDFIMLGGHRNGIDIRGLFSHLSQKLISKCNVPICVVPIDKDIKA